MAKCRAGAFSLDGRYCVDECPAEKGYYFDGNVNENDVNACKKISGGFVYNRRPNDTCDKYSYQ